MTRIKITGMQIGWSLLFILISSSQLWGAPVVNPANPVIWGPSGFRMKSDRGWIAAMSYDFQKNNFLYQRLRFAWDDPNDGVEEARHVEIRRSSQWDLNYQGMKFGVVLKGKYFLYTLLGVSESTLQFKFSDGTIKNDQTGDAYSIDHAFTSDGNMVWGAGCSFILFEPSLENQDLFKLGLDFKYRRFELDSHVKSSPDITYSSNLDELQLALVISRQIKNIYPYFGVRITRMTGDEKYRDPLASSEFSDPVSYDGYISSSANVGFVIGNQFNIYDFLALGIEYRFGDENGYGVNASFRY